MLQSANHLFMQTVEAGNALWPELRRKELLVCKCEHSKTNEIQNACIRIHCFVFDKLIVSWRIEAPVFEMFYSIVHSIYQAFCLNDDGYVSCLLS